MPSRATTKSNRFGSHDRRLCMLALLLTLAVAVQDSGAFVVRLGTDTLSLEQYKRTATQLRGDYVIRAPRSLHRIYVNDLNPDGTVRRSEAGGDQADGRAQRGYRGHRRATR